MNRPIFLLAMALCMTSAGWAAAESATLENAVLRLEVQQSPNPYIARLVHKASGQAVVAEPSYKGLFAIFLDKADGSQETIESGRAGTSTMNVAKTDTGNKLTLTYGKFPGLDLAVEVTATCDVKEPLTHWSIRVENRTGRRLRAVRFPQLLAVPTLGTGKDDVLVLPALPGTLIENPAENWRVGQSVTLQYPGNLSAQFLAYQDPTAGVYLAGTNRDGWPMSLVVFRQADGLRLWHEFTVASDGPSADNVWESPYPVALGVTQGAWYDSADQYKQWAVRQPWCAKPLAQRDDIPAWLKAGPDVHVVCVRTYDSQRTCTGSYYPKLLEHLRTFRDKLDGPVVAMLAGWENHRRWTGGDYFPIFDEPQARTVISQLAQEGFRPFFYLSGLFFTYWNEGRDGGEIPAAQKYSAAYVVDEKTGKPKQYVLNESNPSGDWKRHSYQFCVGSPETKEFFYRVVDQAQSLGVNVLQMDQTVSGVGDACASAEHRHSPGAGRYQSQAFWDLLDALRAHGKRRSADFALLHEEPHEQLIPHLDGFHVREYYEKRWYRAQPGAIGIPLFSYLYHEYALGYGGDSAGLSKQNSRWNVRTHAMNLVAGRTPGGAIWSSHASMSEAHPDQIAILRNHSRLLKTRAKEFLMLGRMLHPLKLDVPTLTIAAPLDKHSKDKGEVPTPAILTSSWQSPDGRIGHLFVNISETKQPLNVRLDTRNVPARGTYDVELYESKDRSSFQPLWQGVQLPKEFARELAPMEVVFLELREAR